jgi:hypothetical protein
MLQRSSNSASSPADSDGQEPMPPPPTGARSTLREAGFV